MCIFYIHNYVICFLGGRGEAVELNTNNVKYSSRTPTFNSSDMVPKWTDSVDQPISRLYTDMETEVEKQKTDL